MEILLQTSELRVSRDAKRLVFVRRTRALFLSTVLSVITSALFFALSSALAGYRDGAYAMFARLPAAISGLCACLFPIRMLRVALARPTSLDAAAEALTIGRTTYPFERVARVRMRRVAFANMPLLAIVADVGGEEVELASGIPAELEPTVERIVEEATAQLATSARARTSHVALTEADEPRMLAEDVARDAEVSDRITRRFMGSFFIVMGLLWSSIGYVVMPDVVLAPRGATYGFIAWPLGLAIAPLGLMELAGKSPFGLLAEAPRWKAVLFGLLWLTPYLVLGYRVL